MPALAMNVVSCVCRPSTPVACVCTCALAKAGDSTARDDCGPKSASWCACDGRDHVPTDDAASAHATQRRFTPDRYHGRGGEALHIALRREADVVSAGACGAGARCTRR